MALLIAVVILAIAVIVLLVYCLILKLSLGRNCHCNEILEITCYFKMDFPYDLIKKYINGLSKDYPQAVIKVIII